MKNLLILGVLLLLVSCSCCNNEDCVNPTPVTSYGVIVGLSIDDNDKKSFEMIDGHKNTIIARYKATELEVGDSIKYTSPADTCTCYSNDLGTIVKYGKATKKEESDSSSYSYEDEIDYDSY